MDVNRENKEVKAKNLLIITGKFEVKNYSPDSWEVFSLLILLKKKLAGAYKFLREKRTKFYIGRDDFREKEFKYPLLLALFLARAGDKKFIDDKGNEEKFSRSSFIFIQTPKFILELTAAAGLIILAYLELLVFNFSKKPRLKFSSDKNVSFLRTDYFGDQRTGGSFSHAEGFIGGVLKEGWKVIALAQEKFFGQNIPFHKIPYTDFFLDLPEIPEIAYHFRFIRQALPILRREAPTLIYQRHSFMNASGAVLARKLRIPLILEYNGPEVWVREKWGGFLFLGNLAYLFENTQLKFADKITVVSEPLVEDLLKRGLPREKIIVNPNGVEVEKFGPSVSGEEIRQKYGIKREEILVGFLGSFGAWHGAEILAQAVELVIKEIKLHGLGIEIKFLMIGDGVLRPLVEKILKDGGVQDSVILTGLVPHEKVSEYLAACDILASPHIPNADGTKFFGSPTKLFEYMASQKAIVASDLDQIGQVLKDQETALLGRPGNVDDLAKNILTLAKDKPLREKLALNARREAEKNHTWRKNAQEVIDSYEKLRSRKD